MVNPESASQRSPRPARRGAVAPVVLRALLGLLVIGLAMGVFAALKATKPEPATRDATTNRAPLVRVMRVRHVDLAPSWTVYGQVEAVLSAQVSAEVAGVVVDKPLQIEPGARVRRGERLAAVDPDDYRRALEQIEQTAEALRAQLRAIEVEEAGLSDAVGLAMREVELAEAELQRARDAEAKGAARRVEVDRQERETVRAKRLLRDLQRTLDGLGPSGDRIRAEIAGARSRAQRARRDIQRCALTTPIAGRLQTVDVELGQRVAPGAPVARVVDLGRVQVALRAPASAAQRLAPGDAALLTVDSPGDQDAWEGTVARVAPELDARTRTVLVYVEVDQQGAAPERLLRPGSFVQATLRSSRPEPTLLAPRGAVVGSRAFLVNEAGAANTTDGLALVVARTVELGASVRGGFPSLDGAFAEWIVVKEGLLVGDTLIVSAPSGVSTGTMVRVQEAGVAGVFGRGTEGAGRGATP